MTGSIVQLRNLDDLKKILHIQKTITARAGQELVAVASDRDLSGGELTEEQTDAFIAAECQILEKYAKYPTLTEFQLMPNSYDGYKWGATFGVTLLVGELIFQQLKTSHPRFGPAIRNLFVLFLAELDNPQHQYLIEPLEKHLRVKVTNELDEEVPLEKQKAFVHGILNDFMETMVVVCDSYRIIEVKPGGVVITPLGKRILLHLMDAAKFIEEMTKAHTKFQTTKPKLSMS
jgi:hypothetical protein